jgi:predicted enzyme related to lactoylglutathione lyase
MFAKLNHVAIVSENYTRLGLFYRALFGLTAKSNPKMEALALSIGDGYVGLNINPRMAGRQSGLDHFGIQVADTDTVRERIAKKYPKIEIIKRPGNRPFASFGIHDLAGNYFDLSQEGLENRAQIYEAGGWEQERRISHFALRAVEPTMLADFYAEVFELPMRSVATGNSTSYSLSDGRVTFFIVPWKISDFLGTGIERPALDHLGFEVEDIGQFQRDLADLQMINHSLSPKPTGVGAESEARLAAFKKMGIGTFHFADPDGVFIAVNERATKS